MTDEQIREIEERADEALGPPWSLMPCHTKDGGALQVVRFYKHHATVLCTMIGATSSDMDFIAHARQDIPALLTALRESREREKKYREALINISTGRAVEGMDSIDMEQLAAKALED